MNSQSTSRKSVQSMNSMSSISTSSHRSATSSRGFKPKDARDRDVAARRTKEQAMRHKVEVFLAALDVSGSGVNDRRYTRYSQHRASEVHTPNGRKSQVNLKSKMEFFSYPLHA